MFDINARFMRKEPDFEAKPCVVENVVRLSGVEYDSFARSMLSDRDFIHDNIDSMYHDSTTGKLHCLMVVGEGRPDGILVDSSGYDYARYAALVPGAGDTLPAMRFPALAELNRKLEGIADYISERAGDYANIEFEKLEELFGIDLMGNELMINTVKEMLQEVPGIGNIEADGAELLLAPAKSDVEVLDPTVSKTDMYAYGYSYEGMVPVSKEKALELNDKGYQVYRLYYDDSEGATDNRTDIEEFDGMFGVEDPTYAKGAFSDNIEVFILNSEQYSQGIASGEWLKLPADAETLQGVFERIGIDRASEGAFGITGTRVPFEQLSDFVSKYDSLDELNMLASYLRDMEPYEIDKVQAILTHNSKVLGDGVPGMINLLYEDNLATYNLIDAKNPEELGRYRADEKPDDVSFEQYGRQLMNEENGVFTQWGYVYCRYSELEKEYDGTIPKEHRIVGDALRGLRAALNKLQDSPERPSVRAQLDAARKNPAKPKEKEQPPKSKGGPEL